MSRVPQRQRAVHGKIVKQWILDLSNPEKKENALRELSENIDVIPNLALMLCTSSGTIGALTQEIKNIHPALNPPTLTAQQVNRAYYTLTLLECIAYHPSTRSILISGRIPLLFCPILKSESSAYSIQIIRLVTLAVIVALVQTEDQKAITLMVNSEILAHCLRIMVFGCELSKTVATFTLLMILSDDSGRSYCCRTDRFLSITNILDKVVQYLAINPSPALLKFVICCYICFCDNPRGRGVVRHRLPKQLKDATFADFIREDQSIRFWLDQLLKDVGNSSA